MVIITYYDKFTDINYTKYPNYPYSLFHRDGNLQHPHQIH